MLEKCFASRGHRCTVTTNGQCPEKCSFYKTKEEFNEAFLKSKKILDKKGLTVRYREENPTFDKMCRNIKK